MWDYGCEDYRLLLCKLLSSPIWGRRVRALSLTGLLSRVRSSFKELPSRGTTAYARRSDEFFQINSRNSNASYWVANFFFLPLSPWTNMKTKDGSEILHVRTEQHWQTITKRAHRLSWFLYIKRSLYSKYTPLALSSAYPTKIWQGASNLFIWMVRSDTSLPAQDRKGKQQRIGYYMLEIIKKG